MSTKEKTVPAFILASQSPRRKALLEQAGISISVIPGQFDESSVTIADPKTCVRVLAESKASAVADRHPDQWVMGADTIVVLDNAILGKPESEADARAMLHALSRRTHQVMTGYAMIHVAEARRISETVCTDVEFRRLTDADIEWYIRTGEPFDKAGGYGIQGIGAAFVRRINGSYTNVVGLPLCEVIETLRRERILSIRHQVTP